MAGAKEIRGKIASIKNTQKITKAMEMVAASKMRKAQDRMRAARPYAQKIRKIDPRRNQRLDALAVDLERNGMRCRHVGSQVSDLPVIFPRIRRGGRSKVKFVYRTIISGGSRFRYRP